jgi:hydroxymethylbilane synthase
LLESVAGGCVVPLAGFAELGGDHLHMRARLAHPERGPMLEAELELPTAQAYELGQRVGEMLLDQGGAAIVAAAKAMG